MEGKEKGKIILRLLCPALPPFWVVLDEPLVSRKGSSPPYGGDCFSQVSPPCGRDFLDHSQATRSPSLLKPGLSLLTCVQIMRHLAPGTHVPPRAIWALFAQK